jgi:membrane-associated phospholipid phosphatase
MGAGASVSRSEISLATIIAVMGLAAAVWNSKVGLIWTPPLWQLLVFPLALIAVSIWYRRFRPDEPRIAEVTFFAALWLSFPLFGVRLTYLAAALGLPYQDRLFQQADAFLGFDWGAWRAFVLARPWFFELQSISYNSSIIQPFLLIPILAWSMPQGRNAELLAAILLALAVTLVISSTCPAQGPAHYAGIETTYDTLLPAIRGNSDAPLPYNGIIWFPSFHTVMGILFTWALRGRWWPFTLFAANNLIMVLATLAVGIHYLIDVLAGAIVALCAIRAVTAMDWKPASRINSPGLQQEGAAA